MTAGLLSFANLSFSFLNPLLSQRNIINLDFPSQFDYAFLNHVIPADSTFGPVGTAFSTTTNTWMQLIDQNGYPNNAAASGITWGCGVRFPATSNFAGPYVVTWNGDGQWQFTSGTWTEANTTTTMVGNANGTETLSGFSSVVGIAPGFGITGTGVPGSTTVISVNYATNSIVVSNLVTTGSSVTFTLTNGTYTKNSNGKWTNVTGKTAYIVVSNSGFSVPALVSLNNLATGGTDGFATGVAVYRQVDEIDFMPKSLGGNGLIFRKPFKQMMVDLNPAAIRFLNWDLVNNSTQTRFEYRSLPSKVGAAVNWTAGPAYGATSGTNTITLASSTGTAGNSGVTPPSMVHGEVATARMTNTVVGSGSKAISGITQANPGVVNAVAHGFTTGDQIILFCGTSSSLGGNPYVGMVEINYVPVTATVIDADHFSIGIDTTTFTAFTIGTKNTASCCEYITLQVGSGNDRTAYPVAGISGSFNVGTLATPWAANTYLSLTFDKNIAANRTAGTSSNWNMGVWTAQGAPATGNPAIYSGGMPIEYCASLIVEINTLAQSQGITNPVHAMLNMPGKGLQPVDPDYTTASDWALNQVSVFMNGANGFPGLIGSPLNPSLIHEYSNETWNFAFLQTQYLAWLNFVRNGSATTDTTTMSALRSTLMARNIQANSPYTSRVKITLGMQGAAGSGAPNSVRASGIGTNYFSDAWNTWQAGLTPMSQHDCCNAGSYFDMPTAYSNTVTGTGTFTDDSAMFNGLDNTSNGGGNYSVATGSGPNPTQAVVNFVAQQTGQTGQTIKSYCDHANPSVGLVGTLATLMVGTYGKKFIGYEGGTDWQVATGGVNGTHTNTSGDNLFLTSVNQSSQWATAQIGFFNDAGTLTGVGMMPLYNFVKPTGNIRWGYVSPDAYATILGTPTEGAALDVNSPLWTGLGTRNQGLTE